VERMLLGETGGGDPESEFGRVNSLPTKHFSLKKNRRGRDHEIESPTELIASLRDDKN